MTGDEMNATARRFLRRGRAPLLAAAFACAGGLTGCASYDPFDEPTDRTSPAAGRVEALAGADLSYPRWSAFPAAPRDVPTPADIRTEVTALETADAALARDVAAIAWFLSREDLEPWAARTRNRVDRRLAQPAPPGAVAEAEAWAREQRARATPPPPIDN